MDGDPRQDPAYRATLLPFWYLFSYESGND